MPPTRITESELKMSVSANNPGDLNLKQLLLVRSDWFAQEIMKRVRRSDDYAFITPAQSRLLALMGGKAMSLSELARRLAISRQAVHRTVSELRRRGVLEVQEDPARGNSKLVLYTAQGKELNRSGARIIEEIENRVAARIGGPALTELKRLLASDWH